MPVTRCPSCRRGLAGYLDSEKELCDLTLDEIRTEIPKYAAKEARIRDYIENLLAGTATPQIYPEGRTCPGCGNGWREFESHRKDLEQLTMAQARAALAVNSRWLNELICQEGILTAATTSAGCPNP